MGLLGGGIDLVDGAISASVRGIPLELIQKGSGRPIFFLHGMDGIEGASSLIDRLAARFQVCAPSHPGFGATKLPDNFSTVDDLAYFYLDLLDQLDLKNVCLVAMSFGGWIAAEILIKSQARFSKAILGAPLGIHTSGRPRREMLDIFMLPPQEAERLQYAKARPSPDLARLPEKQLRRILRNREAMSLYGWSPYLNDPKLAQRLHRVTIPTLLMWGSDDAIALPAYRQAYAAALQNARFETIKHCGHRLYADQPERASELIVDFASEQAS